MKRSSKRKSLAIWVILTLTVSYCVMSTVKASPEGELIWVQTENPMIFEDLAFGVAVDSSGAYIVGYENPMGSPEWRIEKRSLTDGTLIWSRTSDPSAGDDSARCVAVDGSGIYVVGYDNDYDEWRIEKRSLTNGDLIWSTTSNPSPDYDEAYGVAVDSSGIYVVGYDSYVGDDEWRIEKRSLTNGDLIWSTTSNPGPDYDEAYGVAVDGSGIYIVGSARHPGADDEWRIEKRSLTDGTLIWSRTSDPSAGDDAAYGVAVDGSGIYVVGYDSYVGDDEWRIEKRSLTNGDLIWSTTSNPSPDYDEAFGVAVDGSGIYVVGCDFAPGDLEWRIEKRDLGLAPLISRFNSQFAMNNVRVIYPSDKTPKPLGRGAAMVSDWLASAFVSTKLHYYTEGFDTDGAFVDQTSGKPIGGAGIGIAGFGGPMVGVPVYYYELNKIAPVIYCLVPGAAGPSQPWSQWYLANGAAIPETAMGNTDGLDLFLIEVFLDADGRYVFIAYGVGWKGTYAAGKYFHTTIYPNLASYSVSWIIVKWEDTNGDGFVNNPDDGDTYTVLKTG